MTEISRRRTDELRDFVAMLEFATVDFDYCSRVFQQTLRQRFDKTCFARSSRTQKHRPAIGRLGKQQATRLRLIHLDDLMNGIFLPDDSVRRPSSRASVSGSWSDLMLLARIRFSFLGSCSCNWSAIELCATLPHV